MSDVAKEEIAALLDRCGTRLVEKLVADPVFDAVRQHMPRGTKSTLVCSALLLGTHTPHHSTKNHHEHPPPTFHSCLRKE